MLNKENKQQWQVAKKLAELFDILAICWLPT